MMKFLWIFLLIIQEYIHYGQTNFIGDNDDDLDPLSMDEAYLIIRNKNYIQSITVKHNLIVCEKCDFDTLVDLLPDNTSETVIINTKFTHDFEIFVEYSNTTLSCGVKSYDFIDGGTYLFEISKTQQNESSCSINPIKDEEIFLYWLPIIIGFVVLFLFILLTQIWHCLPSNQRYSRLLPNVVQQGLSSNDVNISVARNPNLITNDPSDDIINTLMTSNDVTLTGPSSRAPANTISIKKTIPNRLRSLDTFRGFSLWVMIFVNYGGGGYWFFHHSIWNGLTIADLVFPWFTWMMGISIVLSQRSLRAKNVRKIVIFLKICRRTLILFMLGLMLQGGFSRFKFIRIFGVLQRLAVCYFFAAVLVLIFDDKEDEPYQVHWPSSDDVHLPFRSELSQTLFHFWPQWLFISLITMAWILITFIPKLENCPQGYVGPGGKHDHGAYQNCTGGVAGYIDRKVLGMFHIDNHPTCKDIYETIYPYDPEGILGILTGTLLCYLGVQAGHSFAHSTSIGRVCGHWLVSGFLCGVIGLILSKGGHSESWIPINKNLWSLSFILVLAGLAFIILTILYLIVDVKKWFTGEPFLWLGMNSIVIYVGHEVCAKAFPVQFQVERTTHAQLLAMHLYGVFLWTIIAGLMYRKKFFIAV